MSAISGPVRANHGTRTLEIGHCTTNPAQGAVCPETDNDVIIANEIPDEDNVVQQLHTIRAVLRNAEGTADLAADLGSPIDIDFEIESGPGDPDNANDPIPPDFECTVDPSKTSCQVQYTSNQVGSNTIRAWIDHDKDDGRIVDDPYDATEARFANTTTDCGFLTPMPDSDCFSSADEPIPNEGAVEDPDGTDVIRKTWTEGPAARLDCDPEDSTNPSTGSGDEETYTCTVTDAPGNPVPDEQIDGENRQGANDPDNANAGSADYDHHPTISDGHFCTTDSNGQCSDTVDAIDAEAGDANICFWVDVDKDNANEPAGNDPADGGDCDMEAPQEQPESNDLTDTVIKKWRARSAAQGGVDAEPETDSNSLNTAHTITATGYDQFGAPFQGDTTVRFERFLGSPHDTDGNTPASPDRMCTTNNSSTCSIEYTGTNQGTDLWCVWTSGTPSMSGNNTNGTCDGEGLNDPDDTAGSADPPEPANDDQDVVQKTWGQASPSPTGSPTATASPTASPTGSPSPTPTSSPTPGAPECSDGVDNDGDGKIDHPADPGCDSPQDDDETDEGLAAKRVDTDVRGFDHGSPFTGNVTSSSAKCERGRTAVVKKVRRGKDRKVGTDRSNRSGRFKVGHRRPHGDGRFYAKIKRKTFTNNRGRLVICSKARSRTITVR